MLLEDVENCPGGRHGGVLGFVGEVDEESDGSRARLQRFSTYYHTAVGIEKNLLDTRFHKIDTTL